MIDTLDYLYTEDRGRFKVLINHKYISQIHAYCTESREYETGGILIGFYNDKLDLATVTQIINAPIDSKRGNRWFQRGVAGLQTLLVKLWIEKKHYYIGEWHYHPQSDPEPSSVDLHQMNEIASSQSYRCPEPILLIIGGGPKTCWTYQVMVFPKNEGTHISLRLTK